MEERLKWCGQACGQIRFKPDRERVRQELLGHMEDEYESLRASGLCENEAERRTVERMGDPVEVGRLLDRVHQPLLGWLWLISKRAVAILTVFVVMVVAYQFGQIGQNGWSPFSDCWWRGLYETDEYLQMWEVRPECVDTSDGYRFSVPVAAYVHHEEQRFTEYLYAPEWAAVYGNLRVTGFLPYYGEPQISDAWYTVDSQGNIGTVGAIEWSRLGLFSSECKLLLTELEPGIEWIELRYDQAGRDIVLRIDLTGGESG